MTPQREKYLAKCSEREWCCRRRLFELKNKLKTIKLLAAAPDNKYWLERIKQIKYEISAYRHELARLKGMDRATTVPVVDTEDPYGYENYVCKNCKEWLAPQDSFCPICGRKILWEKVSKWINPQT